MKWVLYKKGNDLFQMYYDQDKPVVDDDFIFVSEGEEIELSDNQDDDIS